MGDRRTLGDILQRLGRISQDQVDEALAYQRAHGGYFGEALVALDLVSPEEMEWGLASQFDLPYIFPDPASVDPDAVALVSPEWALSRLTIPIMKTGNTLTVVVDSPLRTEAVEELASRTGLEIQLALASPMQIRELIRQVYARATAREEREPAHPCSLEEGLGRALEADARRFGISARDHRAWFWYDDAGTVRRQLLDTHWERVLDGVLEPAPSRQIGDRTSATFSGLLARDGITSRVDVRYLAGGGGREFLFRPVEDAQPSPQDLQAPDAGVLTEVRLLARSGSARFIFTAEPPELARGILHELPALFFEPSWRSVHISTREAPDDRDALMVQLSPEPGTWPGELEALRAFHFDVVTVDLPGDPGSWTDTALDVASVAFLLWDPGLDPAVARDAGIRWRLHVARKEGGHLSWSLASLDN
ncbi:MAG TPA: hypothetical protein VLA43_06295 [Longimicrobiales bacterium]|nr:hypothetical protein [Longimicrobiales bacterium]